MDAAPFYFAYGSNLCGPDLARWCRETGCGPVGLAASGRALLPDRRLAFTHRSTTRRGGVLDILSERGCAVDGMLFRLPSKGAIALLDRKEGEGHAYARISAVALSDEGAEVPAITYEVVAARREAFVPPAAAYLDIVRRGYAEHGIATDALDAASRGLRHRGPVSGLFVYGTLLPGEERHPVLARHGLAGGTPATTSGVSIWAPTPDWFPRRTGATSTACSMRSTSPPASWPSSIASRASAASATAARCTGAPSFACDAAANSRRPGRTCSQERPPDAARSPPATGERGADLDIVSRKT
jgi:cation transport regulator ChaC